MAVKESWSRKEKRLKNRKSTYKLTYGKGVFFLNHNELIEWIKQKDIVIRMVAGGLLDDNTEFIQVTIEGFKHKLKNSEYGTSLF